MGLRLHQRSVPGWSFWLVLAGTALILVLGYMNLINADYYSQGSFHQKQAAWIVLGLILMSLAAISDLRLIEAFSEIFYWLVILLLVLVLIVGREINHSKRWLFVFGVGGEPSELAKVAVLLVVAKTLHYIHRPQEHTIRSLMKPIGYVLLPAFLIMMEPDLGTGLLIILFSFSMFVIDGMSWKSLGLIILTVVILFPIAWYTGLIRPYQKERLKVWMHIVDKKEEAKVRRGSHFQPSQAVWAVGSGGLTGKGAGRASQSRLKYLPEMHTDFVFAIFAEERGFLGSLLLIGAYMFLSLVLLWSARSIKDRFGGLILIGTALYLFWQSFINIGMVSGLLPVVGLTLPLFSYGGSSLLATLMSIGLSLNVLSGTKRL